MSYAAGYNSGIGRRLDYIYLFFCLSHACHIAPNIFNEIRKKCSSLFVFFSTSFSRHFPHVCACPMLSISNDVAQPATWILSLIGTAAPKTIYIQLENWFSVVVAQLDLMNHHRRECDRSHQLRNWDDRSRHTASCIHRQLQFDNLFNNSHHFRWRLSFMSIALGKKTEAERDRKKSKQIVSRAVSCCVYALSSPCNVVNVSCALMASIIRKIINIYYSSQFVIWMPQCMRMHVEKIVVFWVCDRFERKFRLKL